MARAKGAASRAGLMRLAATLRLKEAGWMTRTQSRLYCGRTTPRSRVHICAETSLAVSLKERSCGPARKALRMRAPAKGSFSRSSTISEPQMAARSRRPFSTIGRTLTPTNPEMTPLSFTCTRGRICGSQPGASR
ncbi:hypothetical protein D9M68_733280 [compost metagenome]